ncbi:hypothetical protein MBANPS3_012594, partial [Mucor bainieri]
MVFFGNATDPPPQGNIVNRNSSIKTLDISVADIRLVKLHYLDLKFNALEDLRIRQFVPIWISAEEAV